MSYKNFIFLYLDSLVLVPTVYALEKFGTFDYMESNEQFSLSTISKELNANEGYLNTALRTLTSQGLLTITYADSEEPTYSVVDMYKLKQLIPLYLELYEHSIYKLNKSDLRFFNEQVLHFITKQIIDLARKDIFSKYDLDTIQKAHIEGVVCAPLFMFLKYKGMSSLESYFVDNTHVENLGESLRYFNLCKQDEDTFVVTEKTQYLFDKAESFGVTISYHPTFRHLPEHIFGDPLFIWKRIVDNEEFHVDRTLNVWGSGGAHKSYFRAVKEIIIDIFNKPLELQPIGVVDVGCGDGSYLEYLHNIITTKTLRGQHLEENPLILIGIDYNKKAIEATVKKTASIGATILWGDISQPGKLANDILKNCGYHLEDFLNVRTFLDHNRIWDESIITTHQQKPNFSTGAYAFKGERLNPSDVLGNLKGHLSEWLPYLEKYGLLLIELHTIDPTLVVPNLGNTPITAYDSTHGYTDQFIVEIKSFLEIAAELGLKSKKEHTFQFPKNELGCISIVHFLKEA